MSLFIVVSGLPGSGKTTLARRIAPLLNLPVIDKDEILDELFELRGVGDNDWRKALSRDADLELQRRACQSRGAILVSFWRLVGMAADSGTSTEWLQELGGTVVQVSCICGPQAAAERFLRRSRHPGHLDSGKTREELVAQLEALSTCPPLEVGVTVHVDTNEEPNAERIAGDIRTIAGVAS